MPRKILNDYDLPPEQLAAATAPLRPTDILPLHEDLGSGEFASRRATPAALKDFTGSGASGGADSPEGTVNGTFPDQYWRCTVDEAGTPTLLEHWLKTSGENTVTGWTLVQKYI